MANARRGEIAATLDGRERTLCLTLGALAELEDALGLDDLGQLGERLSKGLRARDIAAIVAAGLRGAGESVSADDVLSMRCDGGAAGFAALANQLLRATFPPDAA